MKKIAILTLGLSLFVNAHFLTFLPNMDNVTDLKQTKIDFDISFIHPFEQSGMTMEKPEVFVNSKENKLVLKETKKLEHKAWSSSFEVKTPAVYKFFVQPQPYFEPAEEKFISHVPKVIISSFGLEDSWDEPIGLKYEIIPMSKPFALYAGNLFQGKVLHDG